MAQNFIQDSTNAYGLTIELARSHSLNAGA